MLTETCYLQKKILGRHYVNCLIHNKVKSCVPNHNAIPNACQTNKFQKKNITHPKTLPLTILNTVAKTGIDAGCILKLGVKWGKFDILRVKFSLVKKEIKSSIIERMKKRHSHMEQKTV